MRQKLHIAREADSPRISHLLCISWEVHNFK